jgi:hypothetical protein
MINGSQHLRLYSVLLRPIDASKDFGCYCLRHSWLRRVDHLGMRFTWSSRITRSLRSQRARGRGSRDLATTAMFGTRKPHKAPHHVPASFMFDKPGDYSRI